MADQHRGQEADFALMAEEVMAAIRELHERDGIDDVFGRLSDEAEPRRTTEPAESRPWRYSMVIEWSDEDQVFVVSLPEWGDRVHTHGSTDEEALQHGKELIEGLIASREESGEPLPHPRTFAGA
ncbi:MAG TPA: type II toxin-antitoxin system HicB family antitoxin [Chloroflexota bacterium]|nr:type II toxin-antitoxin system HicB family antitoxin [Chloroflexota bacterium]